MESEINLSYYHLLYLLSCALHEKTPDLNMLKEMNFKSLYKISCGHSVTALIGHALEKTEIPEEIKNYFLAKKNQNIKKTLLFMQERNVILSKFDEMGIYYVPLKGCILEDMYPSLGIREFADNDILYDATRLKDVTKIFKSFGYDVESVKVGNHDVFQKKPFYNFEMHRMLMNPCYPEFHKYFLTYDNKRIKDEGNKCGYHFSSEDHYIFICAHAYKHYAHGGTGIRSVTDFYIYNLKNPNMDRNYIEKELKKLDILEFEKTSVSLANKCFNELAFKPELSEEEHNMLSYIFNSGTYGTMRNSVNHTLAEKQVSKFAYLLSRAFPPYSWYKSNHPAIAKSIVLIPFYTIYRLLFKSWKRTKEIKTEIQCVKEYEKDDD